MEKLRRESIRLSQIQDIAGCRLITTHIAAQDGTVEKIKEIFTDVTAVDRRQNPSHGYRAMHLMVRSDKRLVEVQVRTALQHLWAELSEDLSDAVEASLKYGKGPKKWRERLDHTSKIVAELERLEVLIVARTSEHPTETKASWDAQRLVFERAFKDLIDQLAGIGGRRGVIPD